MGIEPTSEAWEAPVLPLYDARSLFLIILSNRFSVQRFGLFPRFPPRRVCRRGLAGSFLHRERTCLCNRMKMSRLSGPSPIPVYATWISGTFFLCGSRKKGNGLGAPTAQKKSACAPCISSGKLKWFTVARSSCISVRPFKTFFSRLQVLARLCSMPELSAFECLRANCCSKSSC